MELLKYKKNSVINASYYHCYCVKFSLILTDAFLLISDLEIGGLSVEEGRCFFLICGSDVDKLHIWFLKSQMEDSREIIIKFGIPKQSTQHNMCLPSQI